MSARTPLPDYARNEPAPNVLLREGFGLASSFGFAGATMSHTQISELKLIMNGNRMLTNTSSRLVCLDLEGVLCPEIWIEFSLQAAIPELAITTRDEPDYDKLMAHRLRTLKKNGFRACDLLNVIDKLTPYPGAQEFLNKLRREFQVVILSDTFYQFAAPLMYKLNFPMLFCNYLTTDEDGRITGYRLRMPDHKRAAVSAFKFLQFDTVAVGDSYNDIGMLTEAHRGFFFRPPDYISAQWSHFPVLCDYEELYDAVRGNQQTLPV